MDKHYFTSLDPDSKTELTWNFGEMISGFELPDRYASLFVLDGLFVEIHVNKESNSLEKVSLQEDSDCLLNYISELDISSLFR